MSRRSIAMASSATGALAPPPALAVGGGGAAPPPCVTVKGTERAAAASCLVLQLVAESPSPPRRAAQDARVVAPVAPSLGPAHQDSRLTCANLCALLVFPSAERRQAAKRVRLVGQGISARTSAASGSPVGLVQPGATRERWTGLCTGGHGGSGVTRPPG